MVVITLGNQREFYMTDTVMGIRQLDRGLVVSDIELGPATTENFNRLLSYIEQLRIHTS